MKSKVQKAAFKALQSYMERLTYMLENKLIVGGHKLSPEGEAIKYSYALDDIEKELEVF